MSYRLGCSPKNAATGKQGAHDDSHPLERRHFRRFNTPERCPPRRRHANQDSRKKGKQQQTLPVSSKVGRCDRKTCINNV